MIFVGIDVASEKHDCFIINENGVVYAPPFTIANNDQGFSYLKNQISSFAKQCKDHQVNVVLESTGHYSYNILNFLVKQDYKVYYINPLLLGTFKKTNTLRKTKTDKYDCQLIARYLFENIEHLAQYKFEDTIYEEMKILTRHRAFLVDERSKVKVNLKRVVNLLIPEFCKAFSSIYIDVSFLILFNYPSKEKISNIKASRLFDKIKSKLPHIKITISKCEEIINIAKGSIGTSSTSLSLQMKSLIRTIQSFDEEIREIDAEIDNLLKKANTTILSIPGISNVAGATILGEIGDINKFKSSEQLVAYAGFDPVIYESGKFISSYGTMSKRGSKYLRTTIWRASLTLVRCDEAFRNYYLKKKAENMHHNKILGHIGKKFLRLLYSILKYKLTFQFNYKTA